MHIREKKTLEKQVVSVLHGKLAIGESRAAAKKELRERLGEAYRFGTPVEGIHSFKTYENYIEKCTLYAHWLEAQGVSRHARILDTKNYAERYLADMVTRYERGDKISIDTIKGHRSALGKLFGERVEVQMPKKERARVTRSRAQVASDRHFSEIRNADSVLLARACGTREQDLANMRVGDFCVRNGELCVSILRSKGGRDRIAPVLREYQPAVRALLERCRDSGLSPHDRIIDHVHTKMDVHAYRREYAQALYRDVAGDRAYRDTILSLYPARREVAERDYITRPTDAERSLGVKPVRYNRDDVYCVTEALGHNRLEVAINSYLR